MAAARDAHGRFVKGTSGNPGGRPAIPEGQKELLRDLVPAALEIKRKILLDDNAPLTLRNAVADSVLDRVYGKPVQTTPTEDNGLSKLDLLLAGITEVAEATVS